MNDRGTLAAPRPPSYWLAAALTWFAYCCGATGNLEFAFADEAAFGTATPTSATTKGASLECRMASYPVAADRLAPAMEVLRRQYAERADVRVAVDRQTSRIVLFAPEGEHQRIERWIASWPKHLSQNASAAAPTPSGERMGTSVADGYRIFPPSAAPRTGPTGAAVQNDGSATAVQTADHGPASHEMGGGVRLIQQTDDEGASPAPPSPTPPNEGAPSAPDELMLTEAAKAIEHTELLRRLGFDVQIEVLPSQDALILRGRDVDVDAVAEIIREIERVAARAKPQIEIVPLRHTPGGRLVELFNEVSPALVEGRQGRVVAKAMGKPNAVLLIGWGEAFASAMTLIEKLDQPVEPQQEVRVFRLRHATAPRAQTVVQEFYAGRTGIAATVKVVADPRSNALVVYASPRDMKEVELLLQEIDVGEGNLVKRVRVFELKHALAADLLATLRSAIQAAAGGSAAPSASLELLTIGPQGEQTIKSGILDGVEIAANAQTNTLIVSASPEAMTLMEALIERLDQPVSTAQIKVFRIEHGDANNLVLMLRALLPTETGATARPQLPGAEGESSLTPLRFAVEQRTNSIIASGAAGDLRIVHALLLRLDEDETQRRKTTVYRLKNAPAFDVARAVNEFLSSERQVQQAAPGEESALEQLDREVIVVPEPVSNSLIVSATRRFYEEIVELVEKLDAQPPQVVIQVLIAQVTLSDTDEFGVEMGLQDSVLFDRSLLDDLTTTTTTTTTSTAAGVVTSTNQIVQSATNTPGFNFGTGILPNSGSNRALAGSNRVGGQGLTNFSVGRINNELGFGGLVLSASSESVSLLIRALQESRRLEVLSRPQITTLDNQQAFVQVGQRVPRVVSSTLSAFGQTNSVELENVGLILVVTPRISPNGMVVMEVDAERSEVGPEAEGIPIATSNDGTIVRAPRIEITTAQTTVTAASGETILLSGLITQREFDVHRRVPILADIPLLGDLFRYDLKENRRNELLIILTPQVILGPDDAERIRQIEASRMHWCAADVMEIHGVHPLFGQPGAPLQDGDVPVVYPDQNPRGEIGDESRSLDPSEPIAEPGLRAAPDAEIPVAEIPDAETPDAGAPE